MTVTIDARVATQARWINGTGELDRPNIEYALNKDKIVIIALRDLKQGEELIMDYGPDYSWRKSERKSLYKSENQEEENIVTMDFRRMISMIKSTYGRKLKRLPPFQNPSWFSQNECTHIYIHERKASLVYKEQTQKMEMTRKRWVAVKLNN